MNLVRCLPLAVLLACIARTDIRAIDVPLSRYDMARALALAGWPSSDSDRARFHERYLIAVNGPVVDFMAVEQVEVITEFRRLELIAEEHVSLNDLFGRAGVQDAEQALRPSRGQLSLVVHFAFQGMNPNINSLPSIEVARDDFSVIPAIDIRRTGIYGYCVDFGGCALIGGRVESVFEAVMVGQRTRSLRVRRNGTELAHVVVDFARLE